MQVLGRLVAVIVTRFVFYYVSFSSMTAMRWGNGETAVRMMNSSFFLFFLLPSRVFRNCSCQIIRVSFIYMADVGLIINI